MNRRPAHISSIATAPCKLPRKGGKQTADAVSGQNLAVAVSGDPERNKRRKISGTLAISSPNSSPLSKPFVEGATPDRLTRNGLSGALFPIAPVDILPVGWSRGGRLLSVFLHISQARVVRHLFFKPRNKGLAHLANRNNLAVFSYFFQLVTNSKLSRFIRRKMKHSKELFQNVGTSFKGARNEF